MDNWLLRYIEFEKMRLPVRCFPELELVIVLHHIGFK